MTVSTTHVRFAILALFVLLCVQIGLHAWTYWDHLERTKATEKHFDLLKQQTASLANLAFGQMAQVGRYADEIQALNALGVWADVVERAKRAEVAVGPSLE